MQSHYCPHCRQQNFKTAKFCQLCGRNFPTQYTASPLIKNGIIIAAVLIGIIAIGIITKQRHRRDTGLTVINTPPQKPTKLQPTPKINAEVRFTGTQFIIKNTDYYNWQNVKMEINGGLFSGGYELKQDVMLGGETYTVGALQFADSDGQRFNPFQMKPKKFSICGDTPDGLACYVGEWN